MRIWKLILSLMLSVFLFEPMAFARPSIGFSLQNWHEAYTDGKPNDKQIAFALPEQYGKDSKVGGWNQFSEGELKFALSLPKGTTVQPGRATKNPRITIALERVDQTSDADGACGGTTSETGKKIKRLLQEAKTAKDGRAVIGESNSGVVDGGLVDGPIKVAYALSDCQGLIEDDELIEWYEAHAIFLLGDNIISLQMDIPVVDQVKAQDSPEFIKQVLTAGNDTVTKRAWEFFINVASSITPSDKK